MALLYHPKVGEILLCDFDTGFFPPEMIKVRPVAIVSPRLRRREGLVAVVPLSTTEPSDEQNYHVNVTLARPLPRPFQSRSMGAKCDMVTTLSLTRLDRFKLPRQNGQQRQWVSGHLEDKDIIRVKAGILHGLGLSSLTIHL